MVTVHFTELGSHEHFQVSKHGAVVEILMTEEIASALTHRKGSEWLHYGS